MILVNQVRCNKCGDAPYSANRHDFKSCKCGAISVDGGMDYLRRVGDVHDYTDMSIEIPDQAYQACIDAIKWAKDNHRNDLGLICAIARALRDNGVKLVAETPTDDLCPSCKETPASDRQMGARSHLCAWCGYNHLTGEAAGFVVEDHDDYFGDQL